MTIKKKRTVIKKRRVVRRTTVSSSMSKSKPKLFLIKTPRRGSGRKLALPTNLPEPTHHHEPQSGASDTGWRRA